MGAHRSAVRRTVDSSTWCRADCPQLRACGAGQCIVCWLVYEVYVPQDFVDKLLLRTCLDARSGATSASISEAMHAEFMSLFGGFMFEACVGLLQNNGVSAVHALITVRVVPCSLRAAYRCALTGADTA